MTEACLRQNFLRVGWEWDDGITSVQQTLKRLLCTTTTAIEDDSLPPDSLLWFISFHLSHLLSPFWSFRSCVGLGKEEVKSTRTKKMASISTYFRNERKEIPIIQDDEQEENRGKNRAFDDVVRLRWFQGCRRNARPEPLVSATNICRALKGRLLNKNKKTNETKQTTIAIATATAKNKRKSNNKASKRMFRFEVWNGRENVVPLLIPFTLSLWNLYATAVCYLDRLENVKCYLLASV